MHNLLLAGISTRAQPRNVRFLPVSLPIISATVDRVRQGRQIDAFTLSRELEAAVAGRLNPSLQLHTTEESDSATRERTPPGPSKPTRC